MVKEKILEFLNKEEEEIELDLKNKVIEKVKIANEGLRGEVVKVIPYTNQKDENYLTIINKNWYYAVRLVKYKVDSTTKEVSIISMKKFPDEANLSSYTEAEAFQKAENIKWKLKAENLLEILTERLAKVDADTEENKSQLTNLEKEKKELEDKLRNEQVNFQRIEKEKNQLQVKLEESTKEYQAKIKQQERRIKWLQSGEKPRNILIIGKTGSGKSTLANVLLNKNDNFEKVFREEESTGSVTKNLQVEELENEGISYHIIDTVGVGDTGSINQDEAWAEITKTALSIKDGFSQILFVIGGRNEVDEKEMNFYNLLKDTIIGDDIARYTTIVRTKFGSFDDDEKCEKDREGLESNRWISEMAESCKIIHVNNPSLDGYGEIAREKREKSRKKLLTHLETCRKSYKPEKLNEFVNKLSQSKVENIEIQKGGSQKWDAEKIREIAKTAREIMEEVAPTLKAVVVVSAACKIM